MVLSVFFRLNLGNLARKVLSIFQNDCVQQYQEALALHSSRMRYRPLLRGLGFGRGDFAITHRGSEIPSALCYGSSVEMGMEVEMGILGLQRGDKPSNSSVSGKSHCVGWLRPHSSTLLRDFLKSPQTCSWSSGS